MTSRRSLLLGAAATLVGARLAAACDAASPPGDGATSSTAATTTTTTNSAAAATNTTTTTNGAISSSAPIDDEPTIAASPWEGVDFAPLDSFIEATNGEAFAIWEDGAMVHQWYRGDESYTRDVASAQKSVLSLLVGRAIGDGLLSLETSIDDVLGREWTSHRQTSGITVEHLLTMTSGLDDSFEVIAPPGTRWHYSGAFSALFDVVAVSAGRDLNDVADDWLFTPAGARSSSFYDRPAGIAAPIGLRSTVPDLIAIGALVLAGGPEGLADGWLDRSFSPSQAFNRSYGLLWWLNGQETFMLPGLDRALPGPLVPSAPPSMVAALGKDDQKLYVVPELRLVVARLGGRAVPVGQAARSPFDNELWERLGALRG